MKKVNQRKKFRRHCERVWKTYDADDRFLDRWRQSSKAVAVKRNRWIVK